MYLLPWKAFSVLPELVLQALVELFGLEDNSQEHELGKDFLSLESRGLRLEEKIVLGGPDQEVDGVGNERGLSSVHFFEKSNEFGGVLVGESSVQNLLEEDAEDVEDVVLGEDVEDVLEQGLAVAADNLFYLKHIFLITFQLLRVGEEEVEQLVAREMLVFEGKLNVFVVLEGDHAEMVHALSLGNQRLADQVDYDVSPFGVSYFRQDLQVLRHEGVGPIQLFEHVLLDHLIQTPDYLLQVKPAIGHLQGVLQPLVILNRPEELGEGREVIVEELLPARIHLQESYVYSVAQQ